MIKNFFSKSVLFSILNNISDNKNDLDSKKKLIEAERRLLEREKKLLEQERSNFQSKMNTATESRKADIYIPPAPTRKAEINNDAKYVISNFLAAENSRDFSYIYSFYSPFLRRYFGHNNPTYSSLSAMYQKAWNSTPYSKNNLISIDQINGNQFLVKINYEWSKNSNPSQVNSKYDNLKFVLDNDNKIIEVSSIN